MSPDQPEAILRRTSMETRHPLADPATMPARRVLVLEADPSIRELISLVLESAGFEVVGLQQPEAALDELARRPPHAVLVDLARPGQSGWTFLERCRQQPGCAHLPIAVMSATLAQAAAAAAARERGYGWLSKPFELDHLLALVDRLSRQGVPDATCATQHMRRALV